MEKALKTAGIVAIIFAVITALAVAIKAVLNYRETLESIDSEEEYFDEEVDEEVDEELDEDDGFED